MKQTKTQIALYSIIVLTITGAGFQAASAYVSDPDSGFNLVSTNLTPIGITFHDGKFWIVDRYDDKVFVYYTDGTLDSNSGFDLISENNSPLGIAFYDNKFYVLDNNEDTTIDNIFVYNTDGTLDGNFGFDLTSENIDSTGITLYDNKFWVVDFTAHKVFVYDTDGTPNDSFGFDLTSENTQPIGITFADEKFWVVDFKDSKVFAYDIDGTLDGNSGFNLVSENGNSAGITFHDGKFWVLDWFDKIYVYAPEVMPDLEARLTSLETLLNDMKTILSNLEGMMSDITARIEKLEADEPTDPKPTLTGVSGIVYTDSNENGIYDSGEIGVSGKSIIVVNFADQTDVNKTSTDANGNYSIELKAGGYLIQVEGTSTHAYITITDGSVLTQNLGL